MAGGFLYMYVGGANRIAMNTLQNIMISKVLEWNIRGGNPEYMYRY